MDDECDLTGVKTLRLFPLPGVVFFPHSVLPLHIFEPRYRQMTADALESDGLITMVMARPARSEESFEGPPELEEYACVGRIFKHKQLSDGRYNLLLVGLKRVRLIRELATDKLYRLADAEIVEEPADSPADTGIKKLLVNQFRRHMQPSGGIDQELDSILSGDLSLAIVTDILAHTLPLTASDKQTLLAETNPKLRVANLLCHLKDPAATDDKSAREFPPSFSAN